MIRLNHRRLAGDRLFDQPGWITYFCFKVYSNVSWFESFSIPIKFYIEGTLPRDKMSCFWGLDNRFFLQVPLACLGSMAEGTGAGTSVQLWENSFQTSPNSSFCLLVHVTSFLDMYIPKYQEIIFHDMFRDQLKDLVKFIPAFAYLSCLALPG